MADVVNVTDVADDDLVSFSVTAGGIMKPMPLPNEIAELEVATDPLVFHGLESGHGSKEQKPLILLLHGFPELAYSWRKVMPTLASAGYHVVAVDQRGYGRTSGWDDSSYYNTDLESFSIIQYVSDIVHLVYRLGYETVKCIVGHDMGSVVASWCSLMRPDMFTSCVLMSHPFKGPPPLSRKRPLADEKAPPKDVNLDLINALTKLQPPRKHYKWDNANSHAAEEWDNPPNGLHSFLRGYFHLKSAAWRHNQPHPLQSWKAEELAKLPAYYCMTNGMSMAEIVDRDMEGEDSAATTSWLSDEELAVYASEWKRTGFQGALNFYRTTTAPPPMALEMYAGAPITVPCAFISGDKDWGNHQEPGALEGMAKVCPRYYGFRKVYGAGHWPQQEQPGQVVAYILDFIWKTEQASAIALHSAPARTQTFAGKITPKAPQAAKFQPAQNSGAKDPPSAKAQRADTPIEPRESPFASNHKSKGRTEPIDESKESNRPSSSGRKRQDTPIEPKESPFASNTPPRQSTKQRQDTPIESPMSPFSPSNNRHSLPFGRQRNNSNSASNGPALAVDSSARNANVYKEITERNQPPPPRKSTPFDDFDDMETHHISSGDEDDNSKKFGRFR